MKKHTTLKSKFNSAFSLVELLVVIAVIAVIAAIAIPNITGAREAAVGAKDAYNTDSKERFFNQVKALGATVTDVTGITNGYSFTNTNTTPNVVLTWQD
jgi:prepilin-type N-terminal cleavage/methylation domain-containing protein